MLIANAVHMNCVCFVGEHIVTMRWTCYSRITNIVNVHGCTLCIFASELPTNSYSRTSEYLTIRRTYCQVIMDIDWIAYSPQDIERYPICMQ